MIQLSIILIKILATIVIILPILYLTVILSLLFWNGKYIVFAIEIYNYLWKDDPE